MARLAVLADIHANADALEAVLADAASQGVTQLVILGDLIGYYYQPLRVLELLEDWPAVMVLGNHEVMLDRWINGDQAERDTLLNTYGHGLSVCEEELDRPTIEKLVHLPHPIPFQVESTTALLCHGHPLDINR